LGSASFDRRKAHWPLKTGGFGDIVPPEMALGRWPVEISDMAQTGGVAEPA
jgi:hypothetical protein